MTGLKLELMTFPARFRMHFAHGSATRSKTENVICIARSDGLTGYGEGCPRGYVTGETVATAARFFDAHQAGLERNIRDLPGLRAWIAAYGNVIDENPAAFCAIEIALIDLFAQKAGQGIEAFLGLPPPRRVLDHADRHDAEQAAEAAACGVGWQRCSRKFGTVLGTDTPRRAHRPC